MVSYDEINKLAAEIKNIKITTSREIKRLEEEIQVLRRSTRRTSVSRDSQANVQTGTIIINTSPIDPTNFVIHQDKYGVEIHLGSKVKFLTKGKYNSAEGVVVHSDTVWVRSRDHEGRLIKRSPRNLKVLE